MISGLAALGRALGVSKNVAHKYVGDPRWPFGRGPWAASTLERMQAWRQMELKKQLDVGDSNPQSLEAISPQTRLKMAKIQQEVIGKKIDNELKQKKLHNVEDCKLRRIRQIEHVKGEIFAIVDRSPHAADVKEWFRKQYESLLKRWATQVEQQA